MANELRVAFGGFPMLSGGSETVHEFCDFVAQLLEPRHGRRQHFVSGLIAVHHRRAFDDALSFSNKDASQIKIL